MARFDVYSHPDPGMRRSTPYLLDVQNTHLQALATRVVIPLRLASLLPLTMRDLHPKFRIGGKDVVADTAALAAFPGGELKSPVTTLQSHAGEIASALDTLFGAY